MNEYRVNYTLGYVVEFYSGKTYAGCHSWLLFPAENLWHEGIRGFLYLVAMFYLFFGVAISSDIFMNSIEVMTSKKRKVLRFNEETQEYHEVEVLIWNETVANLTLMALGSSAPEIMLSVIETCLKLGEKAEDSLGTFTIIGSAAFNLLMITSVCIVSLEKGQIKNIREIGVFLMTSMWSLWAYIWLLLVVVVISPEVVDPWEGWLTLLFMPIFVLLAYAQDNGWWRHKCSKGAKVESHEDIPFGFPLGVLFTFRNSGRNSNGIYQNLRIMMPHARKGSFTGHAIPGKELHVLEAERQQKLSPGDINSNGDSMLCSTPDSYKTATDICVQIESDRPGQGGASVIKHNSDGTELTAISAATGRLPPINNPINNHSGDISYAPLRSGGEAGLKHEENHVPANERLSQLQELSKDTNQAVAHASCGEDTSDEERVPFLDSEEKFRHAIVRAMSGNKNAKSKSNASRFAQLVETVQNINIKGKMPSGELFGKFTFSSDRYAVLESAGELKVDVLFHRNLPKPGISVQMVNGDASVAYNKEGANETQPAGDSKSFSGVVKVEYETREGSGKAGKDFKYSSGTLTFQEKEYSKSITIPIINDNQYENDVDFYIILKNPMNGSGLGDPSVTRVTIVDDDEPGEFSFEHQHCSADLKTGKMTCKVIREHGHDGKVCVEYSTFDGTAHGGEKLGGDPPVEFIHSHGTLTFEHNETSKSVTVEVAKDCKGSKNFIIALKNPSLGAKIGHKSATICHINKETVDDRIAAVLSDQVEEEQEETWGDQFKNALTIGPSEDDDGNEVPPSCIDYLLHFITLIWKLIGACVPPTKYLGGTLTFVCSLIYIAFLTVIIEQLGDLIGCVIGLKTSVTGITIIALGTSLPDTFASRTAAKQDEHADAAIGNVTGSNSVNVFLGLGLPWVISTSYALATDTKFEVPKGNLAFSVIVFTACGVACIVLLILRRKFVGGELGGKNPFVKWGSSIFLFFLWAIYIVLASLRAYDIIVVDI